MLKRLLFISAATALFSTGAEAACPNVTLSQLQTALKTAVGQAAGRLGLGLNMWATIVAPDGKVCLVANSSGDAIQGQWLASRVISAQKSFTAATLSLQATPNSGSGTALATGQLALSTANLYSAVQPGGSLYGLQHSNPVFAPGAYGDTITITDGIGTYTGANTATYGTANDPMIGQIIGGINVFGGGLALYGSGDVKVGGVGVSGDTSCTDHLVAWYTRANLQLDHLGSIHGVSGDAQRPDNIVFDLTDGTVPGIASAKLNLSGASAGGFGHPVCLGVSNASNNAAATAVANSLPAVRP